MSYCCQNGRLNVRKALIFFFPLCNSSEHSWYVFLAQMLCSVISRKTSILSSYFRWRKDCFVFWSTSVNSLSSSSSCFSFLGFSFLALAFSCWVFPFLPLETLTGLLAASSLRFFYGIKKDKLIKNRDNISEKVCTVI